MLRGLPQVFKESILPIPQIVACNVWGVGPFSLGLLQGLPQATLGISYCLLGLYGPVFWGCTILLWEGGLDGEATLPAWATGWRRLSGAWITAGVVGGVLYRGLGACWLPDPAIGMFLSHWTSVLTTVYVHATGWLPRPGDMAAPPFPLPFLSLGPFFFFFFLNQQFITRCSITVRGKPYKREYSLQVYTCKIGREITALTSPFRVVMSPARAKRGQENDKEHWAPTAS
jgi:hypothetical protein